MWHHSFGDSSRLLFVEQPQLKPSFNALEHMSYGDTLDEAIALINGMLLAVLVYGKPILRLDYTKI